ncbi:MAG: bifunctional folylpolyglutamate synthase/dihydrofolate synthase, partial [Chloroflexi bacterium]
MDYQAAVNWVLSFADYERWPGFAYAARFDLRRMEVLLSQLGNPHLGRKTVHIAGSKGKGSTAAMIASGLQAADFKVGLYTSPHLHTIRERMTLGFQPIAENDFARLVERLRPKVEVVNRGSLGELTTFEILTALGFLYFQEARVDFQVVEVGLGGRLDATNVVQPEICVITSISHDHTQVLGEDLNQVAAERAASPQPGPLARRAHQGGRAGHTPTDK